jgi:hypothetical protein
MVKTIEKRFEILAGDTGLAIQKIELVLRHVAEETGVDLAEELAVVHKIALSLQDPAYPPDSRFSTHKR